MTIKKMTVLAMLTAVYVVLSIRTPIKVINFKFTLEAFPVLVAGLLMGPSEGLLVGLLGSGIYQVLFSSYGITPTTPLWILPHAFSGWLCGILAKKAGKLDTVKVIIIATVCAFCVTLLNTLALYVDSKLYGYYSAKLVLVTLLLKFAAGLILSVLYALILPKLIEQLKKIIR